eukprot:scaffold62190_cov59-Phaeocystis_antarctica.AAC.2
MRTLERRADCAEVEARSEEARSEARLEPRSRLGDAGGSRARLMGAGHPHSPGAWPLASPLMTSAEGRTSGGSDARAAVRCLDTPSARHAVAPVQLAHASAAAAEHTLLLGRRRLGVTRSYVAPLAEPAREAVAEAATLVAIGPQEGHVGREYATAGAQLRGRRGRAVLVQPLRQLGLATLHRRLAATRPTRKPLHLLHARLLHPLAVPEAVVPRVGHLGLAR